MFSYMHKRLNYICTLKLLPELENKIVDLDSELEKAKLAEFETQESVMLINDSVNSVKSDNSKLKEQLKQLDEENRKISSNLEDISFEYDSLKGKYSINEEKLILAETELKKVCFFAKFSVKTFSLMIILIVFNYYRF